MRVCVTGGRDFKHIRYVWAVLTKFDEIEQKRNHGIGITTIVHGGARGVDKASASWARYMKEYSEAQIEEFLPDYEKYEDKEYLAPLMRNQAMVDSKPDVVIAFPGGNGTADMVKRCNKAGLKVIYAEDILPFKQWEIINKGDKL